MSGIKSQNDIILKNTTNYILDTNGIVKTTLDGKRFTDVYSDFKANVPLALKKN